MKHFPIFLNVEGQRIVVSGGGEEAVSKLRLLLKTEARIEVYAQSIDATIHDWAARALLVWVPRAIEAGDAVGAALFYGANGDDAEDNRAAEIARADGALVNIVDNLEASAFITPAIVDRDPVTVAIGTEGAAPVLARSIKASLEESLPASLGLLARVGKSFRHFADSLPMGRARRDFWADYYFNRGPRAVDDGGDLTQTLHDLLDQHLSQEAKLGHIAFVGAGPGDPELLTLKARKELDRADVVIYDRLVGAPILELARREALMIDVGKEGFGPSTSQSDINHLIVEHAAAGAYVVRLKGGDATVFGRLDEEIDAATDAGIEFHIVPGITAASASVAAIGQSLTKRGRNTSVRFLTGHDMAGFADHDWRALARTGEVAAIYMGKKSARFIQGRLIMHGADPATPVSLIENASRPEQRIVGTTLADLPRRAAELDGPALTFLGLAPRAAQATLIAQKELA